MWRQEGLDAYAKAFPFTEEAEVLGECTAAVREAWRKLHALEVCCHRFPQPRPFSPSRSRDKGTVLGIMAFAGAFWFPCRMPRAMCWSAFQAIS